MIKKEISVGNIVQIASILIAVVGAYFTLDNRVSALEIRVENIKEDTGRRLESIEKKLDQLLMRFSD